jgi:predicted DNA-binding transcriptional regulator AlpA
MKADPLATPDEVAEYLQKPPKTLAEWRSKGRGPQYYKLDGGHIRYDWADVRAWLAAQAVTIAGNGTA